MLLVWYLFSMLPSYLPRTSISFDCVLLTPSTKCIELTNPTNKQLEFVPVLVGSTSSNGDTSVFSLNNSSGNGSDVIRLDPKQTMNVLVTAVCRFTTKVSEGRLVLVGRRNFGSGSTPTTMAFALTARVDPATLAASAQKSISLNSVSGTDIVPLPLYEMKTVDVEITNPLPSAGKFALVLSQSWQKEPPNSLLLDGTGDAATMLAKRKASTAANASAAAAAGGSSAFSDKVSYPEAFWTRMDRVALRRGETVKLPIQFLPFRTGTYECRLQFSDEHLGEFVYRLTASVGLPAVSFRAGTAGGGPKCEERSSADAVIEGILQKSNPLLDKALEAIQQRFKELKLTKRKAPEILPTIAEPAADSGPNTVSSIRYSVEYLSPYLSGPSEIILDAATYATLKEQPVKLPVNFHPADAGVYTCKILLRSPYDMRLAEVECKAVSKGLRAGLDFVACARQAVVQEIPITNTSKTQDWAISAEITSATPHFFSGPSQIHVGRGQTNKYLLKFAPDWISASTAQLTLFNTVTEDKMVYDLRGIAEEPLASNHIVVRCKARETVDDVVLSIPPNELVGVGGQGAAMANVSFDLPFVTGQSETADITRSYRLRVQPPRSGTFTGSVTFTLPPTPAVDGAAASGGATSASASPVVNNAGRFWWFTLEIIADRPDPEGHVDLLTGVRQPVIAEISIANPFDHALDFDVVLDGTGLQGESTLHMEPSSISVYPLVYCPTAAVENGFGVASFCNDELGEFWYSLRLSAQPAEDVVLPELKCEVGLTAKTRVTLENPLADQLITVLWESSNPQNFSVDGEVSTAAAVGSADAMAAAASGAGGLPLQDSVPAMNIISTGSSVLVIPPLSAIQVQLSYRPSTLQVLETGTVIFRSVAAGDWVFRLSGRGTRPSLMETTRIAAPLGRTQTSVVAFRNPFNDTKAFLVSLVNAPGNNNCFSLLMRPTRPVLRPFAMLQIPVAYSPSAMAENSASLVVQMEEDLSAYPSDAVSSLSGFGDSGGGGGDGQKQQLSLQERRALQWVYPLSGTAECTPADRPVRIRSKCRTRHDEDIDIMLPDVSTLFGPAAKAGKPLRFVHSLVFPPEHAVMLNRVFSVTPLAMEIPSPEASQTTPLRFHVAFVPLRPFGPITVQLVIQTAAGAAGAGGAGGKGTSAGGTSGRWKFDVELEATPAVADDTIVIEAAMQKTESVVFRLENLFPTPSRFMAGFTADSPLEFTVVPTQGILAPASSTTGASGPAAGVGSPSSPGVGSGGTQFIVSYTANNYGKAVTGTLVIETDEMQWRYEVRGQLPQYQPPQHVRSKIDTRLPVHVETQLLQNKSRGARNFLKENILSRGQGMHRQPSFAPAGSASQPGTAALGAGASFSYSLPDDNGSSFGFQGAEAAALHQQRTGTGTESRASRRLLPPK